jgi:hypothetical protein
MWCSNVAEDHFQALIPRQRTRRMPMRKLCCAIALGQDPPAISRGTVVGIARQPIEIPKVSEETGIEAELGPVRPGVLGSAFPLPASITLLEPPASGRGGWLTAPSFSLRLDPRGLVAGLLDQVSLGGYQLTNPTLAYDVGTDSFTAAGTVSIPTKYPGWDSPTSIAVRIRSSSLETTAPGHVRRRT